MKKQTGKGQPERTMLTARVPAELLLAIKHRALDEGKRVQDIVTDALTAYMAKKGGK